MQKWSVLLYSALQSNDWSGVLVGVQQSAFQKNDWLKNGLHSKIIFGFGLWIALQNIGVLKSPEQVFYHCWFETGVLLFPIDVYWFYMTRLIHHTA